MCSHASRPQEETGNSRDISIWHPKYLRRHGGRIRVVTSVLSSEGPETGLQVSGKVSNITPPSTEMDIRRWRCQGNERNRMRNLKGFFEKNPDSTQHEIVIEMYFYLKKANKITLKNKL